MSGSENVSQNLACIFIASVLQVRKPKFWRKITRKSNMSKKTGNQWTKISWIFVVNFLDSTLILTPTEIDVYFIKNFLHTSYSISGKTKMFKTYWTTALNTSISCLTFKSSRLIISSTTFSGRAVNLLSLRNSVPFLIEKKHKIKFIRNDIA